MFVYEDRVSPEGISYKKALYHIEPTDEKVGVIFGHFSPFTGPKGHGRMLEALKQAGCTKFFIGIPNSKAGIDKKRNLFTLVQRTEIANLCLDFMGLEGTAGVVFCRGVSVLKIAEAAVSAFGPNIRPIFCFGPDRQDLASTCVGIDEGDGTRLECILMNERGEEETSGTKVREAILQNDIDGIISLTGYDSEIASFLIDLKRENIGEGEMKVGKKPLNEDFDFTNKVYNALSDVAFQLEKAGYRASEDDFKIAFDWFMDKFFDSDDLFEEVRKGTLTEKVDASEVLSCVKFIQDEFNTYTFKTTAEAEEEVEHVAADWCGNERDFAFINAVKARVLGLLKIQKER